MFILKSAIVHVAASRHPRGFYICCFEGTEKRKQ